jgi:uncharacterized protein YlxP (DUF503 family)
MIPDSRSRSLLLQPILQASKQRYPESVADSGSNRLHVRTGLDKHTVRPHPHVNVRSLQPESLAYHIDAFETRVSFSRSKNTLPHLQNNERNCRNCREYYQWYESKTNALEQCRWRGRQQPPQPLERVA